MDDDGDAPRPDERGVLTLRHQGLAVLPAPLLLRQPRQLLVLDLSHNALEELPREIGKLTLLRCV